MSRVKVSFINGHQGLIISHAKHIIYKKSLKIQRDNIRNCKTKKDRQHDCQKQKD